MAARLTVLVPRLIALVVIWLLAAASLTFAAGSNQIVSSRTASRTDGSRPSSNHPVPRIARPHTSAATMSLRVLMNPTPYGTGQCAGRTRR